MLGIRSFGSNLFLCIGGKSTQTSEDMLSVIPPSSPYLGLQDQMPQERRILCLPQEAVPPVLRPNDLDHFRSFAQSVSMYLCGVPRDRP